MSKNAIMIDLDDPRSDKIADAISNKTSKKILSLLAENEMAPSDIAEKLKLPLNTITYNLKNLTEAGLTEKSKKLFWSSKGKKMDRYRVSNKKIIISPRSMIKGVLPTILITGAIAFVIRAYTQTTISVADSTARSEQLLYKASDMAMETAGSAAAPMANAAVQTITTIPNSWTWFLLGGLTALLILLVWNWRKNE